jgi:type IX secretion system PorP/SprF family membrane protein
MKSIFLFLILHLISVKLLAQQDEQMSLYQYNLTAFNPAYTGMKGRLNCSVLSRFQWINFPGAPNTQWLSVHSSILKNRLGIGAVFIHDQIGKRGRTGVNMHLASAIKLKGNEQVRVGFTFGVDQYHVDFTEALVNDPNDALAVNQFSYSRLNVGLGIYYVGKKFHVGFSIPRIFPIVSKSTVLFVKLYSPHYYFSASRLFEMNNKLDWRQSFLLKYVRNAPITVDLNSTLIINERFQIGILYRLHEAIGLSGLMKIKEQLTIGYNYDFPINGLFSTQDGTHEVMLQYELKEKVTKKSTPKF